MALFARHIGIDYSGAQTPVSRLSGLRCFRSLPGAAPREVRPPAAAGKHWTRRGLAHWLVDELAAGPPALVGVDHAFSFPLAYFEAHGLAADWPCFLDDFRRHWPTDDDGVTVDRVRRGQAGDGRARSGQSIWRRLSDRRCRAKSVFHFDVQGQVAKSTHAGLPWLRFVRQRLGDRVQVWPFDGWDIVPGRSVIAEVYPALWSAAFPRRSRTGDQHDAYSVAAFLSRADRAGALAAHFAPDLTEDERRIAAVEGWILGVSGGATNRPVRPPLQRAQVRPARSASR